MTDVHPAGLGPLRSRKSNLWARDPYDFYCEPRWVSQRLFEEEKFRGTIHDPALGMGNIIMSAREAGFKYSAADIAHRCPVEIQMFLIDWLDRTSAQFDNIVSNPPFKLCDVHRGKKQKHPFVDLCLERARYKVALLLPAGWIQGEHRSRWLEKTPLYRVWFITPRPSMPPGAVIEAGFDPGGGTTDFAWFVWLIGFEGEPTIKWLRRER